MARETDRATEERATETRSTRNQPAGLRRRAVAYLIDLGVVGGPVLAVAARRAGSRQDRALVAAVLATVVGTLYHVVLEGTTGRTAGKAAAGIAVVRGDGSPCTPRAAAVRTALRAADWLPAGYLLGICSIRLTERRQRLGDIAADTVVVHRRDE